MEALGDMMMEVNPLKQATGNGLTDLTGTLDMKMSAGISGAVHG